jgi:hypothetical protein
MVLHLRKIIPAGPTIRGTELARGLLRNLPGGYTRSLLILYHTLCFVGMSDKTSAKILKKKFTPAAPNIETANDMINCLVNFRAFESRLIGYFFGPAEAERYWLYLWPDITANTTGDEMSHALGDAFKLYMNPKLDLTILPYRNCVNVFLRWHGDPATIDLSHDEAYDIAQNLSTTTSNQYYGIQHNMLAGSDPRVVIACIEGSKKW